MLSALIDECVFEDPADAGRIGSNDRIDALRKLAADALEILYDPAARPIHVRAVFEDHVDVRDAEIGEATHGLHVRRRDQRRHDRIGNLIFNEIRAAPHPLGRDDRLDV